MFKKIFLRIFQFITQPARTWFSLADEDMGNDKFLSNYLYPIFGMLTLSAFLGIFIAEKSIEPALKASIREFVSFFAGFYLASFLLKEVMLRMFDQVPAKRCQHFTAYASSLIYVVSMAVSLFNGFGLIYLFLPYTVYLIWEGAIPFMRIREEDQVKFTAIASVIIFVPYLISLIINEFMLIAPVHATK